MHIEYKQLQKIFFTARAFRFLCTGVLNTAVDLFMFTSVLFLLIVVPFDTRIFVAKTIGFITASLCSYYVNAKWTFGAKILTVQKYFVFLFISGVGLLVNLTATYVVFGLAERIAHMPILIGVYCAFFSATAVSLVWNYHGYTRFVFLV